MNLRTPIGVSGVAGAGKDLFFSLLAKKLPVRRFALADKLKWECAQWCYEQYDIDPIDCPREDKEKIRDFLIFHGTFKRKLSDGRFWVNKLNSDVKGFLLNAQTEDIPVITDIRYQEYEKDEVFWVKNELNGILVHISQYSTPKHGRPEEKYDLLPANTEEKRNDPILKANADFLIKWRKIKSDKALNDEYLNEKVEEFVNWYSEEVKNKQ